LPLRAKRRFQDGIEARPRARVTKAWCRRVFDRQWRERLAGVDVSGHRSGNEASVPVGVSRRGASAAAAASSGAVGTA
jgi:hypothetical protein